MTNVTVINKQSLINSSQSFARTISPGSAFSLSVIVTCTVDDARNATSNSRRQNIELCIHVIRFKTKNEPIKKSVMWI